MTVNVNVNDGKCLPGQDIYGDMRTVKIPGLPTPVQEPKENET